MAEQRNKSNKKFMLLSAIGIFMVVDSHTWTAFNLFGDYIPYNSFFMPMFVFISGYFNKVGSSTKLGSYTLKKMKTLLLPYAGIALAVFCIQQLLNWFKLGEPQPVPSGYLLYVLENVITTGVPIMIATPMWFVIALFALLMVYAVLKKLLSRIWNSYVMMVPFTALHLLAVYIAKNMEFSPYLLVPLKIMFFLPFLELGVIYRDHIEAKHSGMSGGSKIALMAVILAFNAVRTIYLPNAYDVAFDDLSGLTGFTSPYIVTPLVSSVAGILFWLTLVDLAGKPVYESRFVNYMSCNTFWIMGFHILFFNILNCILMAVSEHIVELPYFDADLFRGTEWYYWEIGYNFKMFYVAVGVLGPLGLKLLYDLLVRKGSSILSRKK